MPADPRPTSIRQARDLLLPGLYQYDPNADLVVDEVNGSLILAKDGATPKSVSVLSFGELARSDWAVIASTRLGWPAQRP